MRTLHCVGLAFGFLLGVNVLSVTAAPTPSPTQLPSWCVGPFAKDLSVNPIIEPNLGSVFIDPMSGKLNNWEHDNTFNPAAAVHSGKIVVLYRAEDNSGQGIGGHTSRLGCAESADGRHFARGAVPVLYPDIDNQRGDEWPGGCEDPRCVETEDGRYILTYTQWNHDRPRLAVAESWDMKRWTKHGPAFAAALGGKYKDLGCKSGAILVRPSGDHLRAVKVRGVYWMYWGEGSIHAATSSDLLNWKPVEDVAGNLINLLSPRVGKFDSDLAEGGPPVLLLKQGIVVLYNGKNSGSNGDPSVGPGAYSGGEALFDSQDPLHLLNRLDSPFIRPSEPYEVTGQYASGTVFIEGLVHFKHQWLLYYGTADSKVALATAPAK